MAIFGIMKTYSTIMQVETKNTVNLLNALIGIRIRTTGFDNDLGFDISEIVPRVIATSGKLEELLHHLKSSDISDTIEKRVIVDFNIEDDLVTIKGTSRYKLQTFLDRVKNKKSSQNSTSPSKRRVELLDGLPNGLSWESVEIRFSNDSWLDVKIFINDRQLTVVDFERLGFSDKRKKSSPNPNNAWLILKKLALIHGYGTRFGRLLTEPTYEEIARSLQISNDSCMHSKSELAANLKDAFGMIDDPFADYKVIGQYKPLFKLTPWKDVAASHAYVDTTGHVELNEETFNQEEIENGHRSTRSYLPD